MNDSGLLIFDKKLEEVLIENLWIIDGNYNRTIPKRLEYCDTVIYLDFNRITCLMSVIKRVITNYGITRPDMSDNCPERFDFEFLKWIWGFNKKYRKKYYKLLLNNVDSQVVILKNRKDVRKLIENYLITNILGI